MTCIHDGVLRARLDGELGGTELAEADQHLATCADCRARLEKLRAQTARTENLLATLTPTGSDTSINPAVAYAQFGSQFGTADEPQASWITRLFAPRWRPAWGLAVAALLVAIVVGVNPVRTWAQRILAMLRVQKIAVVTIDPTPLMNSSEPDSRPYRLINQFIADNVVVTMDPGKPDVVPNVSKAAQLTGYPIRTVSSLGAPQRIEVNGETAFQMTINRDRIETLLDEVGRSDIRIPESANGALIAVHIPKTVVSMYGDCPVRHRYANSQSQTESLAERKMERMANMKSTNCTYLVQAPSPTVSVPPELNMSEVAEAALQLVGMSPAEAHSFCQTVDWSSTMVVPIPRNTSSYETVTVDGVEGTLITETLPQGNRYSLLWIKNGVIHSLAGHGNSSDALTLAASLR
ncbi:MAG TPA: zf-HC2 domain-containing protein [Terriglobales bacterium]|nr:zf-HC2 domain-containing protein [Terriglobales bacterium]